MVVPAVTLPVAILAGMDGRVLPSLNAKLESYLHNGRWSHFNTRFQLRAEELHRRRRNDFGGREEGHQSYPRRLPSLAESSELQTPRITKHRRNTSGSTSTLFLGWSPDGFAIVALEHVFSGDVGVRAATRTEGQWNYKLTTALSSSPR